MYIFFKEEWIIILIFPKNTSFEKPINHREKRHFSYYKWEEFFFQDAHFYSPPGIGLDHLFIRNLRSAVTQPPEVTNEVLTEPGQINDFLAEDVYELTRFTRQLSDRLCQDI